MLLARLHDGRRDTRHRPCTPDEPDHLLLELGRQRMARTEVES